MFWKLYLTALLIFFAIDMVWLGVIAKDFYRGQIGFLMKTDINWTSAILFYLIFIVGLVFFVVQPSLEKSSWVYALAVGALFGLITYATYDLTNYATLKDWPFSVTVIDLAWGTVLGALVSVLTHLLATKYMA